MARRWVKYAAFGLFWPLLLLWTWKLLERMPLPTVVSDALSFSEISHFVLQKGLHAGVYGTLAGLVWLWVPVRWRRVAVGLLVLHGVGTEIGQTFVPGRHGSPMDVIIDSVGIAIGTLVAWWITRPRIAP